jgi:hypothetical protein
MDQIKTTKNHHYQQLATKDVLLAKVVTFDTSHLLMSALIALALAKAGCVWEKEEERVRCENGPNKNNKGPPLSTIGNERLTALHVCHT